MGTTTEFKFIYEAREAPRSGAAAAAAREGSALHGAANRAAGTTYTGSGGPSSATHGAAAAIGARTASQALAEGAAVRGGAAAMAAEVGIGILGGPLGIALAGLAAVGYEATKAIKGMASEAAKASETLGPYSASLSASQALNQARDIQFSVERGAKLGDSLGRYTEAKGSIDRSMQRLIDEFLPPFLNIVVPLMEKIAEGINTGATLVGDMKLLAERLPKLIEDVIKGILSGGNFSALFIDFMQLWKEQVMGKDAQQDNLLNQFLLLGQLAPGL